MNVYDILKESYNTNEEIIEEGLFRKIKELIKGKNKNKEEKDVPASISIKDGITPYTVKKITSKSMLDKFYKNNDFCIESTPKESSFPQIVANLLAKNYDINTPVEVYFVTGKVMNDIYDLAGDNAYQDSVHHAIIPLDTLKNTKDIMYAKNTIKARYFNDVVDNNEYREYIAGRHKKSPQIQWIINAYANVNETYYDEDELHSSNLLNEENTMSINTLANLARSAGFENLLIESDIVEECERVLNSLDTISESNITGDISVLPVYRVDNNDIDSSISESSLESIEEVSIIDLKNKLSTGIKNFIDKKNQKRENDSKDIPKRNVEAAKKFAAKTTNVKKLQKLVAVHTRNLNLTIENEKKFKSASKEEQQKTINVYNRLNVYGKGKNHTASDVLTDLSTTKSAYKQIINIYSKRIKELESSVKESYFIDLETLYTVSEVYDVKLNEAMNLIKEVNELPEDASVSVVLKEGFENYTTLSEFVDIKETLNEAGIDLAWNKELSDEDFITEAGKLSGLIDKVKDKLKTMKVANLEKTIKQTEDFNKTLKENLKKFDKMSEEEQKSYVNKEFAKDVVVYAGSTAVSIASAAAAPGVTMIKPLLGFALVGGASLSFVPAIRISKKADKGQPSFVKSPKTYKRAITNTIDQNNILIKNCKDELKDAKK